jgi:hypothetical protein
VLVAKQPLDELFGVVMVGPRTATELVADMALQRLVESVDGKVLPCCQEDIRNIERLVCRVPRVDVEDLFSKDVLVVWVETTEELCVEVVKGNLAIIMQGEGNGEEIPVILHDIALIVDPRSH